MCIVLNIADDARDDPRDGPLVQRQRNLVVTGRVRARARARGAHRCRCGALLCAAGRVGGGVQEE